jgi:hypothetical protein
MMTPIVIQLDDDNCDGKVNEKDIPEIVFSTFTGGAYFKQGTLHAISMIDGASSTSSASPTSPSPAPASRRPISTATASRRSSAA